MKILKRKIAANHYDSQYLSFRVHFAEMREKSLVNKQYILYTPQRKLSARP
jgi:hypothetical protein